MEVSNKDFEQEVLKSDKPVLVMFWGSWCVTCKRVQPMLKEMKQNNFKITTCNVDKNPQIAVKYDVLGTPTFILFKDGNEVKRIFGAQSKEQLEKFIQD